MRARFVSSEILARFDKNTMEQDGVMSFFMIFLLPVFPDDAICFIAGLTRLSIPKLMLAAIIGRVPGVGRVDLYRRQRKRRYLGGDDLCSVLPLWQPC